MLYVAASGDGPSSPPPGSAASILDHGVVARGLSGSSSFGQDRRVARLPYQLPFFILFGWLNCLGHSATISPRGSILTERHLRSTERASRHQRLLEPIVRSRRLPTRLC